MREKVSKKLFLLLFLIFSFFPKKAFSLTYSLKINEILADPNQEPYEWVEVVNNGDTVVNSSEISIKDLAGNTLTLQFSFLNPGERGLATSNRILNNTGDKVIIYYAQTGEILDQVEYPKLLDDQSYARCPDITGDFTITNSPTRNLPNTCPSPTLTPTPQFTPTPTPTPTTLTPTLTPTPTPSPTPTPTPNQANSNFSLELSEFYPNPYSGEVEWVEIYNPNDFEVEVLNWKIDDQEGGSSPVSFSTKIPAKSYFALDLPKAMLNNSGDEVRLLKPDGTVADKTSYSSSQKGYSIAKDEKGNWCIQEPTKGEKNRDCQEKEKTPNPTPTSSSNPKSNSFNKTKSSKTYVSSSLSSKTNAIVFNSYEFTPQTQGEILGERTEIIPFQPDKLPLKTNLFSFLALQINLTAGFYFLFKTIKLL